MVSAANEQQRQPLTDNSPSQTANSEPALTPVRAIDFLKDELRATNDVPAPVEKHHAAHHEHQLLGSGTLEEERVNSIAFNYVGAPVNQASAAVTRGRGQNTFSATIDGSLEEEISLGAKKSGIEKVSANGTRAVSTVRDSGIGDASSEDRAAIDGRSTGIDAKSELNKAPAQVVEKLLTLVGPEAVSNLRERLREVWVDLDSTAATELDVMARMPVTTQGLSASEFLMVQSPQGIHFVAFLRNKNDFEVLQTFDRHALLPGNATKQLMEAAMVAYEQLGAIFKEGAARLERGVAQRASSRNQDQAQQFVTQELRGRWIQSKRRRKKCDDLVEEMVEQIDELDAPEVEDDEINDDEIDSSKDVKTERIIKREFERPVLETGDNE